jgi:hypothetical protein
MAVALVTGMFLREIPLRTTHEIVPEGQEPERSAADVGAWSAQGAAAFGEAARADVRARE